MIDPHLLRSWKRTESYLQEALALVSRVAVPRSQDTLAEVADFIEHNELGLACDWLESIAKEDHWESVAVLKLLALAEASMGRADRQVVLDARLVQLLGHAYETQLPSEA
jgi:hypothetical protein